MPSRIVLAIAAYTVIEALRNRLLGLVAAFLVGGFALSQFLGEVAITESEQLQAGFLGSVLRLSAVFTVSLFVITSIVREFADKVVELVLSHPIPRASYYLGKLAGFSLLGLGVAVLCGACLLTTTPPAQALIWTLSLACELLIVTALSLLCLFTFSQVTIALSAVMAFYLLARTIATLQLIAESPLLHSSSLGQRVIEGFITACAFVLPELERFTRADWLVYQSATWSDLAPVVVQTAIYTVLLSAAALFDLYRRNL